jgi:hypothetical protein
MEISEHPPKSKLEFAKKRTPGGVGSGYTHEGFARVLGKLVGWKPETDKPETGGVKPARGPSKNKRNETVNSTGKIKPHRSE